MSLLRLENVSVAFGDHHLLDKVNFQVDAGERVCLVGRNGAGKSTLMKIINAQILPDEGVVSSDPSVKIASLAQDLPDADDMLVEDVIAGGLGEMGELLAQYHHLALEAYDEKSLKKLERIQHKIEAQDGWSLQSKVDSLIQRLELPAQAKMKDLSGGWRRRVMLGRALVVDPDVLLLDEPTNHLDVTAIDWLEKQLLEFRGAMLFITHDRTFLQNLATRIVELDRGNITSCPGDYLHFLDFKEKRLAEEERHNALFDKKLAEEEVWIRQGIKARRTRNEGRVRALKELRSERSARREVVGKANINLDVADKSGKVVVEAKKVSYAWGATAPVVKDLSTVIMRGDRIGLVGPNGAGKSTLLKLLLGRLKPTIGDLKIGTKLEVAYFDQLREQLDPNATLIDNISDGREFIEIGGKDRHIISYLSDFLFTPQRARSPVKVLSGGETNRLLLAKLFSKPANFLVLDEPTNDLDVETLELLEELLMNFNGSVIVVSHDRSFLDNVCSSLLVFEGKGLITDHVGGYTDWHGRGGRLAKAELHGEKGNTLEAAPVKEVEEKPVAVTAAPAKKKLSYKLQRELDSMPAKIEKAEALIEALQAETGAGEFYQMDTEHVAARLGALENATQALEVIMDQWLELEALQEES
jgi:ATP-binding cassette subfamily F protein uup